MEEFFLHLYDEIDDFAGVCRHVATSAAAEALAVAAPLLTAASATLLVGLTLLTAHRPLLAAVG